MRIAPASANRMITAARAKRNWRQMATPMVTAMAMAMAAAATVAATPTATPHLQLAAAPAPAAAALTKCKMLQQRRAKRINS